jgi:hypothetical protein
MFGLVGLFVEAATNQNGGSLASHVVQAHRIGK